MCAAHFISVMRFRPLSWRQAHPYLVADRFEDITPMEAVRENPRCDRDVTLYGYVRGTNWKEGTRVHIAGVGDYPVSGRALAGGRPGRAGRAVVLGQQQQQQQRWVNCRCRRRQGLCLSERTLNLPAWMPGLPDCHCRCARWRRCTTPAPCPAARRSAA